MAIRTKRSKESRGPGMFCNPSSSRLLDSATSSSKTWLRAQGANSLLVRVGRTLTQLSNAIVGRLHVFILLLNQLTGLGIDVRLA